MKSIPAISCSVGVVIASIYDGLGFLEDLLGLLGGGIFSNSGVHLLNISFVKIGPLAR